MKRFIEIKSIFNSPHVSTEKDERRYQFLSIPHENSAFFDFLQGFGVRNLQGFHIDFDRAFVPLLQGYCNAKALSVISNRMLLTGFRIEISYNERSSRAEREKWKIDVDKV